MVSPHRACISTTFKACLRSSPFTSSFHIVNPFTPTSCSWSRLFSSPKELTESTVNKMHVPQGQSAPSGPFHSWTSLESEELNSLDVFADFVWSRSVELGKEVHNVITMATIMTMTVIMTDLTNLANLSDLRPSIFLTLWQSYDIWQMTNDNWDL